MSNVYLAIVFEEPFIANFSLLILQFAMEVTR